MRPCDLLLAGVMETFSPKSDHSMEVNCVVPKNISSTEGLGNSRERGLIIENFRSCLQFSKGYSDYWKSQRHKVMPKYKILQEAKKQ